MPEQSAAGIAGSPELSRTTESEEMYLITVARAAEDGATGPVSVAGLARRLSVSVASANEMVRKLAARGLVDYVPYRGVELTEAGRRIAGRVLRTRRLWATFLAGHLDFTPAGADELACALEHVTPPEAAERLAAWLGDPVAGPLGHPIPAGDGTPPQPAPVRLPDAPVGLPLEVLETGGETGGTAAFLAAEQVVRGAVVTVAAVGSSGLLLSGPGGRLHLDHETAGTVRVREAPRGG
jgi:DtxR family Mn-dependent transcriptional regulator